MLNTVTMRARASDPLTSINAAERSAKFASGHARQILQALGLFHDGTARDIGDWCGLTVVQVDRRMIELKRAGLVQVVQRNGEDLVRDNMCVWARA